jgi:hypothetical protein
MHLGDDGISETRISAQGVVHFEKNTNNFNIFTRMRARTRRAVIVRHLA